MATFLSYIEYIRDFNIVSMIVRLVLATLLSAIMGYERGRRGRAAGLRTHILVCVGAAIASMTGIYISNYYGGDVSRIAAQVISGIGFLGAGTILVKNHSTITGLTTAACVWATGAVGIALGYGFYEAAILGTLIIYFTIRFLTGLEEKTLRDGKEFNLYVEFVDANKLNDTIFLFKEKGYKVENISLMPARSNMPSSIAASITVKVKEKENVQEIVKRVSSIENVSFAVVNYSITL
ncbi:MAG: MgtC/SapB family protein [Clostridia bacterium]|nr:MgtC/SapB family protein [Clostridia bacterium]